MDRPGTKEMRQALVGTASVYQEIEVLTRVMAHLPHVQPFALISREGRVLAANRPLLELLGSSEGELIGRRWARFLPGWELRDHPQSLGTVECFEDRLSPPTRPSAQSWVHVLCDPVGDGVAVVAYALFLTTSGPRRPAAPEQH